MKNIYLFLFLVFFIKPGVALSAARTNSPALAFKENKNQWDKRIIYKTELQNGSVFLCKNNFTFLMEDTADMNRIRRAHHPFFYKPHDYSLAIHLHAFRESFENSNPECKIIGADKLNEYFNYYIGKDPSAWASRVSAYYNITYQNLYNNIDLAVTSQGINMKYNFVIKGGGNVGDISINYEGLDGIESNDGALVMKTSIGDFVDSKPYAYQIINGQEQPVPCLFDLRGTKVSFILPQGYDKSKELVIDPVLIFSTYSGSTADNFGYSATYDSKGNAYVAGTVFQGIDGGHFPVTLGAFQTSWAGGVGFGEGPYVLDGTGTDIGITKYDSSGTHRIYSTYLGGDHDELPHSLIVNSNDELFVLGTTASDNFPVTPNAYDTTFKGGPDPGTFYGIGVHYASGCDMFITRFNADGTALLASTYLGGTDNDGLTYPEYQDLNYNYADEVRGEITIDKNDNVYVASCTRSADFPVTPGAYQTTFAGGTDGVIVKMNDDLSKIIWSTFLGGSNEDAIYSIDFDPNGDLYVTGGTISTDFPHTAGAFQTSFNGGRADGFIAHLSQNGNMLFQSTYYGTPEYDQAYFVRTDKAGNPYLFGQTEDTTNFFIRNAAYNNPKSGQFISKFSPALDSVIWSTTFGSGRGTPDISPTAFLVDVCNKTYISGWGSNFFIDYGIVGSPPLSTSGLQVTSNAVQPVTNGQDFYVMVMKEDASALTYATYFGSPTDEQHVDGGTSRFDRKGIIYQSVCAGCNGLSNFPTTPGAVSRTNNSPNCNNAVFKLDLQLPNVIADFQPPPSGCAPDTLLFTSTSKTGTSTTYLWNFGDGTTSTEPDPSHAYMFPGVYNVQLIINDPGSCNLADTLTKQILILSSGGTDTLPAVTTCPGQSIQIGLPEIEDSSVSYSWNPSVTLTESNVQDPFASPQQTTTYALLASKGNCMDTFYQTVKVINDKLLLQGGFMCPGDTLQLHVTDSLGTNQLIYSWQPLNQVIAGASTDTPQISASANTTFFVRGLNSYGCTFTDSAQINMFPFPNIVTTATPDSVRYGYTSQLQLTLSPNVISYQWLPDTTLSATNIFNPIARPLQNTTYYAEAVDSEGCKKIDSITVYVLHTPCAEANIYIPDAFTPNGDGKDDILYVRGNGITSLYFAVYDRWGQKMFETKNINEGWNGTFNGKKMDMAVFGYYAEGTCESGEKFEKQGNVTLLR